MARLRMLTLNLLHNSTWQRRVPLVKAGLLALLPDIVLLQEVAWPNEQAGHLAAALTRRTGHRYAVHLTALVVPERWQEGLAVLTRFPILTADEPVTHHGIHICQRVRVDVAGHQLDTYNLHLDPYSSDARQRELADVLAWMDGRRVLWTIFGGDFNAAPGDPELALMSKRLCSAYAAVHGREPDHTSPTPFGVRAAESAGRPIIFQTNDYLFISPQMRVVGARLAFTRPDDNDPMLYASDHYGVMADLELG